MTEAGAKVAITGRDKQRLTATARAIGAHPIHSDVAREADVRRSYKELFQAFDHLDVLVNNAGFGVIKPSSRWISPALNGCSRPMSPRHADGA